MRISSDHLVPSRRSVVAVALMVAALFVIANLTAKNSSHPGTVSNIAFVAFVLCALLLVGIGAGALIQSRRRSR
ncbi:MAG: hypothetical protein ABI323_02810 [Solirubrobacteraceae bacterium]